MKQRTFEIELFQRHSRKDDVPKYKINIWIYDLPGVFPGTSIIRQSTLFSQELTLEQLRQLRDDLDSELRWLDDYLDEIDQS